jgi:hypothetical protein
MTDTASRFRIVGGTDFEREQQPPASQTLATNKPKKPTKRPPLKDQIRPFKCTPCSEEIGTEQHKLIQLMTQPFEANGKIVGGGLWWACARCKKPYFLIRLYGVDKK